MLMKVVYTIYRRAEEVARKINIPKQFAHAAKMCYSSEMNLEVAHN